MIRQAHTYLAGAVSGTVLIAVAVVGFVMLVSVQTVKDWPLAGLVGGDDTAADLERRRRQRRPGPAPARKALRPGRAPWRRRTRRRK